MYQRSTSFRMGGPLTPVVKILIFSSVAVFVLQALLQFVFGKDVLASILGLSYFFFFEKGMLWQVVTYMFVHGGFLHIFFNLFALFIFGGDLENLWGSKYFLKYYLLSGVGAGIFITIMNVYMVNNVSDAYALVPTIGASGAIYGILLAYGMNWPNRQVLVYFIFPIKMKYLVMIFGAIEFFGTFNSAQGQGSNISHIGHLGGLITGFLLLWFKKHSKRAPRVSVYNPNGTIVIPVKQKKEGVIQKFIRKQKNKKKQHVINDRIKSKEIIDRLLDKIGKEGLESLTAKERADLEWARKNYYPENNTTFH